MPTTQENLKIWTKYNWSQEGHEWSLPWHGTDNLWKGTLFPRIQSFMPTETILEIAPGYGRITSYLKELCKQLIVVDLAEPCIEACKKKFISDKHIIYHVNDGKSLEMIPDQSIDFVISFASLVHAEVDVFEAYLKQLAQKLKPNGVGFIHHSNVGECISSFPKDMPIENKLVFRRIFQTHMRTDSMSASVFSYLCERVGLHCITQELINWTLDLPMPMDCFSLFTHRNSKWDRPNIVHQNLEFAKEIRYIAQLFDLYSLK